ncbi:transketolase [Streptomyces sp. NPDC058678]|uniref:transketolase n=1 Tax=Streptomyces sp. NPDC058678 TaxID=3346595 RepID=UPI003660DDDB
MTTTDLNATDLRSLAERIRWRILTTHRRAGAGHLGSSLSIVELLSVVLGGHYRWRSAPGAGDGDRFVLSKGHAALSLYCALVELGRLPQPVLDGFGQSGAAAEPHPNERLLDAVDASTGSLGQGFSIGVGMALGARLRRRQATVFVLLGDGECNEGQVWEAARSAAALRLDNLVVLLDDNRMQQDGPTPDILDVSDLPDAWARMGWLTASCDGHDCEAATETLTKLLAEPGGPKLIHARTVKGRGVPFLEHRAESHYPPPLGAEDLAMLRFLHRKTAQ